MLPSILTMILKIVCQSACSSFPEDCVKKKHFKIGGACALAYNLQYHS